MSARQPIDSGKGVADRGEAEVRNVERNLGPALHQHAHRFDPVETAARGAESFGVPDIHSAGQGEDAAGSERFGRADEGAEVAGILEPGGDEDEAAPQEVDAGQNKLGITVSAIPPTLAAKTGIRGGVIITNVRPGSFADEIGLGKSAIITAINRKPITDEASYRAVVSTLKSKDDVVFVIQFPNQKNVNSYVGGTLP